MSNINDEMKEVLEGSMWVLATADTEGTPNAVPIHYGKVLNDTQLLLVDNFMKKTSSNINSNPKVSVSAWKKSDGYQFKGNAVIETEGANFDTGVEMVQGKIQPKGVVIVDVDSIYLTTPGPKAGDKVE